MHYINRYSERVSFRPFGMHFKKNYHLVDIQKNRYGFKTKIHPEI